jgi:hypothetical protein
MVDIEFKLSNEGLVKELDKGYDYAKTLDETLAFAWLVENKELKIQDDYFMIELDNGGWVSIDMKDFTSEMVAMILEEQPELATKDVLDAFIASRAIARKKKDSE